MLHVVALLNAERNAADRVKPEKAHHNASTPLRSRAFVLEFSSFFLVTSRAFEHLSHSLAVNSRQSLELPLLFRDKKLRVLSINLVLVLICGQRSSSLLRLLRNQTSKLSCGLFIQIQLGRRR